MKKLIKNIFYFVSIFIAILILHFTLYKTDYYSADEKECIGMNIIYEANYNEIWQNINNESFIKKWIAEQEERQDKACQQAYGHSLEENIQNDYKYIYWFSFILSFLLFLIFIDNSGRLIINKYEEISDEKINLKVLFILLISFSSLIGIFYIIDQWKHIPDNLIEYRYHFLLITIMFLIYTTVTKIFPILFKYHNKVELEKLNKSLFIKPRFKLLYLKNISFIYFFHLFFVNYENEYLYYISSLLIILMLGEFEKKWIFLLEKNNFDFKNKNLIFKFYIEPYNKHRILFNNLNYLNEFNISKSDSLLVINKIIGEELKENERKDNLKIKEKLLELKDRYTNDTLNKVINKKIRQIDESIKLKETIEDPSLISDEMNESSSTSEQIDESKRKELSLYAKLYFIILIIFILASFFIEYFYLSLCIFEALRQLIYSRSSFNQVFDLLYNSKDKEVKEMLKSTIFMSMSIFLVFIFKVLVSPITISMLFFSREQLNKNNIYKE